MTDEHRNNNNLTDKLKCEINKTLKKTKEDIGELIKEIKKSDNENIEDVGLLNCYLEAIIQEDNINDTNSVFNIIKIVSNIEAELTVIEKSLPTETIQINPSMFNCANAKKLIGNIKQWIKKVLSRSWQLFSQMANLKEWSISGNCKVNVFGFGGGSTTLQLIFNN